MERRTRCQFRDAPAKNRIAARLLRLNLALLALIGRGYLASVPAAPPRSGGRKRSFAYVANFASGRSRRCCSHCVSVLAGVGATGVRRWRVRRVRRVRVCRLVVYQLWRFHFNGSFGTAHHDRAGDSVTPAGQRTFNGRRSRIDFCGGDRGFFGSGSADSCR